MRETTEARDNITVVPGGVDRFRVVETGKQRQPPDPWSARLSLCMKGHIEEFAFFGCKIGVKFAINGPGVRQRQPSRRSQRRGGHYGTGYAKTDRAR